MPLTPGLPFDDSRRLTGPNLYFARPGAVLETVGHCAEDASAIDAWRQHVEQMRETLGWPAEPIVVRRHPGGAALAFAAPPDQLFTATEVNEWAWLCACAEVAGQPPADALHAPGHPPAWDIETARRTLQAYADGERNPRLLALLEAAARHRLPVLVDDEHLTLGLGTGSHGWPLDALPDASQIDWTQHHAIPTALVTGSNGKTTTVRLAAAMLRAQGLSVGYSCTDGLFVDDTPLAAGDYSGPGGARTVLRHPTLDAAVLETARGGLLRRGLALAQADVAVVTNISADHFGEYGIHDLTGLAEAKLVVARAVENGGLLVLNADDPLLRAHAAAPVCRIGWFARENAQPMMADARAAGQPTCALQHGRLLLCRDGQQHDLGDAAAMPLTLGGRAGYNIANAAAAALLASELGVPAATIAEVLSRFGSHASDNPGRLQHWSVGGLQVFMDYAHNPDGLRGLLGIATALRGNGRLALLLGQAGNRGNDAIADLAATAAAFDPALVVLKDIAGFIRGRAPGEVAQVLREALLQQGLPAERIHIHLHELDAARAALQWAQPGDVLVLPVHALDSRRAVAGLLDGLTDAGWQAGTPIQYA
jgi:cyanophycin synthetase